MYITTSDLFYINEVAKLIKQDLIVFRDRAYGISALTAHVCEYVLDMNKISFCVDKVLIFNKTELSAFIKGLTTETGFDLIDIQSGIVPIRNNIGGILNIEFNYYHTQRMMYIYDQIMMMNNIPPAVESEDMTTKLSALYSMKKDDGVYTYIHHDYYMILYYGLLPLNKPDKLYLSIYTGWELFYAKFVIKKSKQFVNVYVPYLKIPKHENKR